VNPAWRTLLGWMSGEDQRARLSVLIYHRVLPVPDPMAPGTVDAAQFDRVCGWLREWFRVLPLEQAVADLKAGRLPARAAAITFDDGYADNHDVAMPILRRHRLDATFFIATGFLDGGRMWNDTLTEALRRAPGAELDLRGLGLAGIDAMPVASGTQRLQSLQRLIGAAKYLPAVQRQQLVDGVAARAKVQLPKDLMLRSDQVLAMRRAGMRIGAHTRSHPILASLPDEQAEQELRGSREDLEALLGEPVRVLAYPNGKPDVDYSARSVAIARQAGFEVAVSTAWGSAGTDVDPLQVPRFTPWDRDRMRFGLRLLGNLRREGRRLDA
jgi:peptidoglycan/xylan/chitin deacetylase (PgdA/CDA1 family)